MTQSRREKVYKRDNYTCQNCGVKGGTRGNATLNAHHIVPKESGGDDVMSNLISLCEECHHSVHYDQKAPTAETHQSQETSQDSSKKVSNPFKNCPVCGSGEIGQHNSANETLQCSDCWSTLSKVESNRFELRVGPRGHHRTINSFSQEETGLTLLSENWKLLAKEDSLKNVDLNELQANSDRWIRNKKTIISIGEYVSYLPLIVLIIIWAIGIISVGSIIAWLVGMFLLAIILSAVIRHLGGMYSKKKMIKNELPAQNN